MCCTFFNIFRKSMSHFSPKVKLSKSPWARYWEDIHNLKCGYWKYSPRVVKISPREVQPWEVIFDHKRWIFPISTFQIVDMHIIHNFMPPCSRLKWKLKKKSKNIYFSKSANIYFTTKVQCTQFENVDIGFTYVCSEIVPLFEHQICSMGASINYVGKILPIFDPLPLRRQVYYVNKLM